MSLLSFLGIAPVRDNNDARAAARKDLKERQSRAQQLTLSAYESLLGMSATNPLEGGGIEAVEKNLAEYEKQILLGSVKTKGLAKGMRIKRKEADLSEEEKKSLQSARDIANRMTARINSASAAANSPGAAAQTRRSQSLLG